jgi:hypothetical protein
LAILFKKYPETLAALQKLPFVVKPKDAGMVSKPFDENVAPEEPIDEMYSSTLMPADDKSPEFSFAFSKMADVVSIWQSMTLCIIFRLLALFSFCSAASFA